MYRVEQKINGQIYVYEVTSYWDSEKKQPRQKRVYLGRKDETTGEIIDTRRAKSVPVGSLSYGTACVLKSIVQQLRHDDSQEIHVILDNHSIHRGVDEWLRLHPNVSFHFTPTSASWLNQIEVWFSILSRSALDGFSARSPKELADQIKKFIAVTNKNPKPFLWKKREVKGAQLKSNIRNLIN